MTCKLQLPIYEGSVSEPAYHGKCPVYTIAHAGRKCLCSGHLFQFRWPARSYLTALETVRVAWRKESRQALTRLLTTGCESLLKAVQTS